MIFLSIDDHFPKDEICKCILPIQNLNRLDINLKYFLLSFIVDVDSVRCQIPHVRFTQAATSKKLSIMPDTWAGVCRTYLSGLLVKLTLAYFS